MWMHFYFHNLSFGIMTLLCLPEFEMAVMWRHPPTHTKKKAFCQVKINLSQSRTTPLVWHLLRKNISLNAPNMSDFICTFMFLTFMTTIHKPVTLFPQCIIIKHCIECTAHFKPSQSLLVRCATMMWWLTEREESYWDSWFFWLGSQHTPTETHSLYNCLSGFWMTCSLQHVKPVVFFLRVILQV